MQLQARHIARVDARSTASTCPSVLRPPACARASRTLIDALQPSSNAISAIVARSEFRQVKRSTRCAAKESGAPEPQRYETVPDRSVSVILLAGGVGKRMGAAIPKQYLDLRGAPIATYSLHTFAFMREVCEVVIVCDPSWREVFEKVIPSLPKHITIKWALPGAERQDSVYNGLQQVGQACTHSMLRLDALEAHHHAVCACEGCRGRRHPLAPSTHKTTHTRNPLPSSTIHTRLACAHTCTRTCWLNPIFQHTHRCARSHPWWRCTTLLAPWCCPRTLRAASWMDGM